MRTTVAVDCDGVLVAVHTLIDEVWRANGLPFQHDPHVTDFDYAKCVGSRGKLHAYNVFRRPDLYDCPTLPLEPGARAGLEALRAAQYKVIAVSSPFAEHAGSKWSLLRRLGFEHDEIFLAGDKQSVRWDVLIDDKAETVVETPPVRKALLYDQPWNRWLTASYPNVRRVDSWDEICAILC